MNLVGLALRNLKRRPIRTCLSILGIGLAVGSALALIALSRSIQESTREGMDEMGDDLVVMQKGSSDIFGGFIPEETVDRIAALPGIVRVSGELVTFAPSGVAKSVLTLGWPDFESSGAKKAPRERGADVRSPPTPRSGTHGPHLRSTSSSRMTTRGLAPRPLNLKASYLFALYRSE